MTYTENLLWAVVAGLIVLSTLLFLAYLRAVGKLRREAADNAKSREVERKAWQDAQAARDALAEDEGPSTPQHAYVPPPLTPEMLMSLAIQKAMQNQVEAANGRPHEKYHGSHEVFANEEGAVFVHGPVPPAEGSKVVIRPDCGTVEVRYDRPFHTGEGISPVPLPGHRCGVSADKPKDCYITPRSDREQLEIFAEASNMDTCELERRIAADKAYRERLGLEAAAEMAVRQERGETAEAKTASQLMAEGMAAMLAPGVTFGPPAHVREETVAKT